MDTSILEEIGLTNAEIKVYLALLELGSSSAGPIVEKSGLQNAVVHRALHSLGEKGIVTYIFEGKKKIYQSVDPKLLVNFIEDKKKRYELLLPELLAKQNTAKKRSEATVYRGVKGLKEAYYSMINESNKDYYAYGGSHHQQQFLANYFWKKFHDIRIKNKISAKIIFQPSLHYWGEELQKKKLTQVKYLKKELSPLQEVIICGNKVAINIYAEKPLSVVITDSISAESYRQFFRILWKGAVK